jgi:hypothetical protein
MQEAKATCKSKEKQKMQQLTGELVPLQHFQLEDSERKERKQPIQLPPSKGRKAVSCQFLAWMCSQKMSFP